MFGLWTIIDQESMVSLRALKDRTHLQEYVGYITTFWLEGR